MEKDGRKKEQKVSRKKKREIGKIKWNERENSQIPKRNKETEKWEKKRRKNLE